MTLFNQNAFTLQSSEFIRKAPPSKDAAVFNDEFELRYSKAKREYLTDAELAAIRPGSVFLFDVESYSNYFLVGLKHSDSGKYILFENRTKGIMRDREKLHWIIMNMVLVGFNSKSYDLPMVSLALQGFTPEQLKTASNAIIFSELLPYQIEQHYKITIYPANHIDLIEVTPLKGSLKLYAARLHCKRIQDMPIEHTAKLTTAEMDLIVDYNQNDLDNSETLLKNLYPQLELRYSMSNQYNVDLRSKSDAQIAEAVISHELKRLTGIKQERPKNFSNYFFYQVPSNLIFYSPEFQNVLTVIRDTPFTVAENGEVQMPEEISKLTVEYGNCIYRLGMGGLHSSETILAVKANNNTLLLDKDVVSYYPQIIVNQELHPSHLGKAYLEVYKAIIKRRVTAKKSGDKVTAASLKITVNGLFGKFGNRWSIVYSPNVLIQITVSGQLYLLMLIEMLESVGIRVVSANTDGVVITCQKSMESTLEATVKHWEKLTGFETEESRYNAIYARDVNNYIAVKTDGEVKVKGSYSERGSSGDTILSKNPETMICNDAAIAFVSKGTPIEETIYGCTDIRRFVTVRNVKGGATKSGKYLGKTIRYYYSIKMKGDIRYVTSGNKVPLTDGAMPLMELPAGELPPDDLDYKKYVKIAKEILEEIGAVAPDQSPQGSLFI